MEKLKGVFHTDCCDYFRHCPYRTVVSCAESRDRCQPGGNESRTTVLGRGFRDFFGVIHPDLSKNCQFVCVACVLACILFVVYFRVLRPVYGLYGDVSPTPRDDGFKILTN